MAIIYNKKSMQDFRRDLRFNQTYGEKTLWTNLRKKQIENTRFLRQYSVNKFIIDFYAPDIKLGIEVDGSSHIGNEEHDKIRQEQIEFLGIKIIRFSDEQVIGNTEKVINKIIEEINSRKHTKH